MTTRLTAIRHGQTTSNENDLVSGGNDDPFLTPDGVEQALDAADDLRGSVKRFFSSPKRRCLITGRIAFGLPLSRSQILPHLNERYYGVYDGGPNSDWKRFMDGLQPQLDELSAEQQRRFDFGPGIENEDQLVTRALGAFSIVANLSRDEPTGISTSGGILRGVLLGCGYDLPTGSIDNLARLNVDYHNGAMEVVSTHGIDFGGKD